MLVHLQLLKAENNAVVFEESPEMFRLHLV